MLQICCILKKLKKSQNGSFQIIILKKFLIIKIKSLKKNLPKFFQALLVKEGFVIEKKGKIKNKNMKNLTVKITLKILPVVKRKNSKVIDLKSHILKSKMAKLILSFLNKMKA